MTRYYTERGDVIYNPEAYARTGAPMYESRHSCAPNVNAPTDIYKVDLEHGKKYIGKTTDIDRRLEQHFRGEGSMVTKKYAPVKAKVVDQCPGFFADELEQVHTEKNIDKYGYENVRGGTYTNSRTLHARTGGSRGGRGDASARPYGYGYYRGYGVAKDNYDKDRVDFDDYDDYDDYDDF